MPRQESRRRFWPSADDQILELQSGGCGHRLDAVQSGSTVFVADRRGGHRIRQSLAEQRQTVLRAAPTRNFSPGLQERRDGQSGSADQCSSREKAIRLRGRFVNGTDTLSKQ